MAALFVTYLLILRAVMCPDAAAEWRRTSREALLSASAVPAASGPFGLPCLRWGGRGLRGGGRGVCVCGGGCIWKDFSSPPSVSPLPYFSMNHSYREMLPHVHKTPQLLR